MFHWLSAPDKVDCLKNSWHTVSSWWKNTVGKPRSFRWICKDVSTTRISFTWNVVVFLFYCRNRRFSICSCEEKRFVSEGRSAEGRPATSDATDPVWAGPRRVSGGSSGCRRPAGWGCRAASRSAAWSRRGRWWWRCWQRGTPALWGCWSGWLSPGLWTC